MRQLDMVNPRGDRPLVEVHPARAVSRDDSTAPAPPAQLVPVLTWLARQGARPFSSQDLALAWPAIQASRLEMVRGRLAAARVVERCPVDRQRGRGSERRVIP